MKQSDYKPDVSDVVDAEYNDQLPTKEEIKKARIAAGLTQEQASTLVFREGRSRWAEWESGTRQMQRDTWQLFLIKTNQIAVGTYSRPLKRNYKDKKE